MSVLDRVVGGVSCRDVLADLSEYVDGALPPSRVAAVQAHLAGCDRCERFGGRFASTVGALRRSLAVPAGGVPPDTAAGLRRRLAEDGFA